MGFNLASAIEIADPVSKHVSIVKTWLQPVLALGMFSGCDPLLVPCNTASGCYVKSHCIAVLQINEMPNSELHVTLLFFINILRTVEGGLFGLAVQHKRATVSTGSSCSYAGEHCTCDSTFLIVATLFARSSVRISSCS